MKARTMAAARGEHRVSRNEPKVWFHEWHDGPASVLALDAVGADPPRDGTEAVPLITALRRTSIGKLTPEPLCIQAFGRLLDRGEVVVQTLAIEAAALVSPPEQLCGPLNAGYRIAQLV